MVSKNLSGQNSDIIITDIGGLFVNNFISFDGGLQHLELIVIRKHTNRKNHIIRLKGQVKSHESPYAVYDIFIGNKDLGNNKLLVTDTIYSFDFQEPTNMFNRRKIKQSCDGIFSIKTKLKDNQALYIHSAGCCMIEIKFNDDNNEIIK